MYRSGPMRVIPKIYLKLICLAYATEPPMTAP
jgi:hypothetical protein